MFGPTSVPAKTSLPNCGVVSAGARFGDVLCSEEGIIANRKKGFFCLTLNN